MLRHHTLALLAGGLLFVQWFALLGAVQLNGVGGLTHTSIYETWAKDYRFVRDDISLVYQGMNDTDALTAYTAGLADFWSTDRAITADDLPEIDQIIQFPVFAQALVMGYFVPAISSAGDPDLVLDRETISRIWTGAITMWNDSAIQALNPVVASRLPAEPITLGYGPDHRLAIMSVAKAALSSFSPEFRAAIAAANGSFALMAPAREGRAFDAGYSSSLRIEWMMAHPNCLAFLRYATARSGDVRYSRMINKAGRLVEANTTSVQAAMAAHATQFGEGNVVADITDTEGQASWPFAFMNFVAVRRNWTTFDCTNSQELLGFLAWMLTNDEASEVVEGINFVPLDLSVRKSVLELLNQVQCNGEESFDTDYLIGTGPSLSVYTSWAVTSGSQEGATIKFYLSNSLLAKNRMATNSVDFGATSNGLSEEWYASIEGLALTPVVVYAFAPGYNVPEVNNMTLVLDFETIASIYLSEITMWNDPRIQAINAPEVAAALPAQPITVITQSISSAITQLLTEMLTATVPRFAAAVGSGALVHFPVEGATNRSVTTADLEGVIPILSSRPYSFTFWDYQDLTLARGVSTAMVINPAGRAVNPTIEALQSALHDYADTHENPQYAGILLANIGLTRPDLTRDTGASEGSWPLATFGSFFYRQYKSGGDCSKARALAGFLAWSQTNPLAKKIAYRQKFALATDDARIMRHFLAQLKNLTCDGVPASDLYHCIDPHNLAICSGAGACMRNECVCDSGRSGQYCEGFVTGPSSHDSVAPQMAGGAVAIGLVLLCLLCALVAALMVATRRRRRLVDDWEIDFDEVELGPLLGAGGYGQVHKALWKGTEVAVKMMASDEITKDMEKSFKDEVRVMTALRHPNVVLFMAASTKPPKMCIVMEFMALGSLFDLLHNELIGDIEFALKGKMAYQAAKGMHFLHSSGIVHRDLKSLNLLLDAKWNVKVSDFGLTKFKADLDHRQNNGNNNSNARDALGSVHWMAPEVLAESPDVDFGLADVYSFGVILWELLTRREPYQGMTPMAVAVAVIRNDARPTMYEPADDDDESQDDAPEEYRELMTSCWDSNPALRPTFLEIMTRLAALHEVGSLRSSSLIGTPSSTTPSHHPLSPNASDDSEDSDSDDSPARLGRAGPSSSLPPPVGDVTLVCTDISRAASLWEFDGEAMRDATLLHNHVLRAALERHRGYEAVDGARLSDSGGCSGSFRVAFQRAADALAWCADVQRALLKVEWPEALLGHTAAARVVVDEDDGDRSWPPGQGRRKVVFKGLRVRMGLHAGAPKVVHDPMTRRVDYAGPVVDAAARITALAHGGQVVLSRAVYDQLGGTDAKALTQRLGKVIVDASIKAMALYEYRVDELEGRQFAGLVSDDATQLSDGRGRRRHSESAKLNHRKEAVVEEEATCLASANLCRWVIDWGEVQLGKQIGIGSYGVVYRGKWKGVEVAVKRFIKQKLNERCMLEFRAEMAFLSELHHPNIVLFVGACVKKPNLCIVTEFVKQGSLKAILANHAIKLTWKQKLKLLHGAALGINYLHSLHPVIVHRDLKPSNLLVDENMNVKVADFGFARIKEENATMTRCGTPCWTAPEILRGEKYDERADVFSFGVVMWQVVTRKEPYAGRNFMGVSLDVLEGRRPEPTPADLPAGFIKAMTRCWHAQPDKRPLMSSVVEMLADLLGHDPLAHAT